MLDALRNFIRTFGAGEKQRHLSEDDSRLALAALLVHSMAIDGSSAMPSAPSCASCSRESSAFPAPTSTCWSRTP